MSYATEWTEKVRQELLAPFAAVEVDFLPKGGKTMPYVDARTVMRRLDDVFGPGGWSFSYSVQHLGDKAAAVQGILTVLNVVKCDAGEAHGEAELLKSAVSDALKRCAVHFGIARYLYALQPVTGGFIAPANIEQALRAVGYTDEIPEAALAAVQTRPRPAPAPSNGNGQQRAPESRGDAAATKNGAAVADWHTRVAAKLKQLFPAAEGNASLQLVIASKVLPKPIETFEGWGDRHWSAYLGYLEKLKPVDVNRIISEAFAAAATPDGTLALGDDVFDPSHPCQQEAPAMAQGA